MKKLVFSAMAVLSVLLVSAPAFAQGMMGQAAVDPNGYKSWIAIAAGFGIAIAAFGGAISQARATAAGLEGIARNPAASGKIQTAMIIGLALMETLVIYALVICFFLQGKI